MSRRLFAFSILLFASSAHGKDLRESCSPVDLKSTLGPVRDQKDTEWCYAYTAADMVTQAMKQEKVRAIGLTKDGFKRDQVSAMQLAHEFQRQYNNLSLPVATQVDGHLRETLERTFQRGQLCNETDLNSDGGTQNPNLRKIQRSMKSGMSVNSEGYNSQEQVDEGRELTEKLVNARCSRPVPPFKFGGETFEARRRNPDAGGAADNSKLKANIDQALNQGRISGLLYWYKMGPPGREPFRHYSSVVARKVINGECHYQIRNSYNLSCANYGPGYREKCKSGNIWVKESDLMKNVIETTYVKPSAASAKDWRSRSNRALDAQGFPRTSTGIE